MSQFDANTGNPPPRRRYRVAYRARPIDTEEPWMSGSMEVISRSQEEAETFASLIGSDGTVEYEITSCEDITEGS